MGGPEICNRVSIHPSTASTQPRFVGSATVGYLGRVHQSGIIMHSVRLNPGGGMEVTLACLTRNRMGRYAHGRVNSAVGAENGVTLLDDVIRPTR